MGVAADDEPVHVVTAVVAARPAPRGSGAGPSTAEAGRRSPGRGDPGGIPSRARSSGSTCLGIDPRVHDEHRARRPASRLLARRDRRGAADGASREQGRAAAPSSVRRESRAATTPSDRPCRRTAPRGAIDLRLGGPVDDHVGLLVADQRGELADGAHAACLTWRRRPTGTTTVSTPGKRRDLTLERPGLEERDGRRERGSASRLRRRFQSIVSAPPSRAFQGTVISSFTAAPPGAPPAAHRRPPANRSSPRRTCVRPAASARRAVGSVATSPPPPRTRPRDPTGVRRSACLRVAQDAVGEVAVGAHDGAPRVAARPSASSAGSRRRRQTRPGICRRRRAPRPPRLS